MGRCARHTAALLLLTGCASEYAVVSETGSVPIGMAQYAQGPCSTQELVTIDLGAERAIYTIETRARDSDAWHALVPDAPRTASGAPYWREVSRAGRNLTFSCGPSAWGEATVEWRVAWIPLG